uniref:Uncharacterized protein n=1 Tax=viral metagenome TaxID=1070528 RepID=A0A6M3KWI4_9ZZZZ
MSVLYAKDYAGLDTAITLGTLAAVGSTNELSCKHSADFIFTVTITGIGTNVVLQFQGSIDGTNWFNIDPRNQDSTFTADGTYYKQWVGEIPYVRVTMISKTGGTPSCVCKVSLARIS